MKVLSFLFVLCHLLTAPSWANGLNILGVFVYPSYSHWTLHNALVTELSKRGHNLTVITNFPTAETTSLYREIHIKPFHNPEIEVREKLQLKSISDIRKLDSQKIIDTRFQNGLSATRHCLSSKPVKDFVEQLRQSEKTSSSFDVMIVEDYYQEALLYLAEIIGCPVIAVNPSSAPHLSSHYHLGLGELNTYAFHDLIDLSTPADNALAVYSNKKYQQHLLQQEVLIKETFQLPEQTKISFSHLYQRVVLLMSNSYSYFNPPSVAVKEAQVGGFYIRPPKELARDIKDFLHDANYGAIFMTLPSQVYGVQMNMDVVNKLMTAFSGLRQKVLFEWDGPKIADQPKNVLIRRHVPISDILAHPYIQLMICTGNIFHVQNSIQRVVPMIGIPITKEEDLLLGHTIVDGNIGKRIRLEDVSVEGIINATKEMFGNQMLNQQIHYVAAFYRNRPLGPLEEAAFWVEFAGKHKKESRIYRAPAFQGSSVIPPYYTKLMTMVGSVTVIAVLVLCIVGAAAFKFYFKGARKGDKKAV